MLKEEDIEVIAVNPPTKEESEEKIKALCEFLSGIWRLEEEKDKD